MDDAHGGAARGAGKSSLIRCTRQHEWRFGRHRGKTSWPNSGNFRLPLGTKIGLSQLPQSPRQMVAANGNRSHR